MNICIFGDSITWGAYDPIHGGWVNMLRNYFESADSPPYFREAGDVEVYNCGISGDKTSDLLMRLEREAQARKPDIIALAIGINDSPTLLSTKKPQVTDEQFAKNIQQLHLLATKYTKYVIFIGLTPIDDSKAKSWDDEKAYRQENAIYFDKIIHRYCTDSHVAYIPLQQVVANEDLFDGLHPNTNGHQKIYDVMKPIIEKLIAQKK